MTTSKPSEEDVRVFLESPFTHDFLSEADVKVDVKPAHRPPKRRKRRERLPPYVPFRSIYEEKDFSKLTERQKVLALMFQSAQAQPSSLFLAVNDIAPVGQVVVARKEKRPRITCHGQCMEDGRRLRGFLEWLESGGRHAERISEIRGTLASLLECKECICGDEADLYEAVLGVLSK